MKTHSQVVVIGGGIAGCSTLYHLTQEGIADCVMVERDELTSGTTWHSAAQVTNFGGNQTMVGLKTHSINLYKEMSEDPDYPINYHHATGGLRFATTQDHLDGYEHFLSMAKGMDVDFEILDPQECKRRHPLITTDNLLGALWDPLDGDIDPAQLCQALARRARKAGAEVYRFTPVTHLTENPDGTWIVHTSKGDISCEKVVNAGGYRCNEVGAMMGVEHPVASMEHQYMLTEDIPEIVDLGDDFRVPLIRCPRDDFYQRAEKKGLLIGFYEQDCKTWGLDGIDPNFTMALCPDDLDRVVDVMEGAFARLPCLETTGIKSIINGPITYTPDGLPLVGKIPGKRNAYCITGLRAGLGEGGGHGWLLAQIIAHGEACYDTWCLDPRRFTRYANEEYTALKAIEDYQNEFRFHMPHEHRPAGRPIKTTQITHRLAEQGAEFGVVNGWERALYFKPNADFEEVHSFRFNNTFDLVGQEVANVQNNVGIMEVSGFNRYQITGSNVHDWLNGIMCSKVSRKIGKVGLAYFLNHLGNVKGEATLANLSDECIWYGSAAASEFHDMDWLNEHLPADSDIEITSLTNSHTILVVAGPKSRDVLQSAAPRTDWSAENFKWLTCQTVHIGHVETVAMAVSFSGELAWELHIPNEQLAQVYVLLQRAGEPLAMKPFGLMATESMRLEKGYRHWKADLITEFNPLESELARFVDFDKEFIGKQALLDMQQSGPRRRFVSLTVNSKEAPAHPGDSVYSDGKVVGTVTSAAWGYRTGQNIAMAFVDPTALDQSGDLAISHVGMTSPCKVGEFGRYDPQNQLVRN
ncbi:MAG: FAD-dependent oxidoreductase [Rhizobiaceae bacterium]|nr:FAD-dependent oxidoreductase [Rhizobiaceae bacterium]